MSELGKPGSFRKQKSNVSIASGKRANCGLKYTQEKAVEGGLRPTSLVAMLVSSVCPPVSLSSVVR